MYFKFKHCDEYGDKKKTSYCTIVYNRGSSMFSVFSVITHQSMTITNWFSSLTIKN